ncbi:hypothetical protein [Novacetimonas sp. GS1]
MPEFTPAASPTISRWASLKLSMVAVAETEVANHLPVVDVL